MKLLISGNFTDSDSCSNCSCESSLGAVTVFKVGNDAEVPEEIQWKETDVGFTFCCNLLVPTQWRIDPHHEFLEIAEHIGWVLQGKRNCVLTGASLVIAPETIQLPLDLDYVFIEDNLFFFKSGWRPEGLGILIDRESQAEITGDILIRLNAVCSGIHRDLDGKHYRIYLERDKDIISVNGYMLEYPIVHYVSDRSKTVLVQQLINGKAVKSFSAPKSMVDRLDSTIYTVGGRNG